MQILFEFQVVKAGTFFAIYQETGSEIRMEVVWEKSVLLS
jgi:hypothetical protein